MIRYKPQAVAGILVTVLCVCALHAVYVMHNTSDGSSSIPLPGTPSARRATVPADLPGAWRDGDRSRHKEEVLLKVEQIMGVSVADAAARVEDARQQHDELEAMRREQAETQREPAQHVEAVTRYARSVLLADTVAEPRRATLLRPSGAPVIIPQSFMCVSNPQYYWLPSEWALLSPRRRLAYRAGQGSAGTLRRQQEQVRAQPCGLVSSQPQQDFVRCY